MGDVPEGGTSRTAPRWPGSHRIDIRTSLPLPGGRWYVTIVAGPERRNRARLEAEGQTNWRRRAIGYALLTSIVLWIAALILLMIYAMKSALGFDLLDGPSPLHGIWEALFER